MSITSFRYSTGEFRADQHGEGMNSEFEGKPSYAYDTMSVFALVNPVNARPFYIGVASSLQGISFESDVAFDCEERGEILRAIAETGQQPLKIYLQENIAPANATSAEAYWAETFLRGGTGLINRQASAQARQRTADIHLAACQRSLKAQASRQDGVEQADKPHPLRHGKSWDDAETSKLVSRFLAGERIADLAHELQRTRGSLVSRLRLISESNAAVAQRMTAEGLLNFDGQVIKPA